MNQGEASERDERTEQHTEEALMLKYKYDKLKSEQMDRSTVIKSSGAGMQVWNILHLNEIQARPFHCCWQC